METTALMAISPLDGRYQEKVSALRSIFSEYGLIRFRVIVEIRWIEMLAQASLPDIPPLSADAKKQLNKIIDDFSEQDAMKVKQIESGINHDVKAVEYFIKEKIGNHAELQTISE